MASPMQTALKVQKRALRKAVAATLNTLTSSAVEEQSRAVTEKVLSLPAIRECNSISCYLSMESGEVNTSAIVDAILRSNKTLYVPKIKSGDGMDFLRGYSADDLASFPASTWGIREPGDLWEGQKRTSILGCTGESLDVILLPGVAFDRTLSRLGHGKGYYDRFISSYIASGRKKPLLVGLSLREQLQVTPVPIDESDWKLDMLVTPDEVIGGVQ
ncbi:5-formyltetrahydrofolate cyclo-ligase [Phlegmacium glaucopus]|nr:5-formyltetrahydrofolate cyclo-ligase [Phlegmacium glaucopus]